MYGHHPPEPVVANHNHHHPKHQHTSRPSHDSSVSTAVVTNGNGSASVSTNNNTNTNINGNANNSSNGSSSSSSNGRRGADILERRIAPGAFHDSKRSYDPPKCQTRSKNSIISMIIQWLMDAGKDNAIMWMYGPAGSGKSSIMQSVAQYCYEQGMLAASFFFAKDSNGLNTEKHLMSTIAYQISHSIPETRRFIAQAIESDPSLFSASLESQLQTLIVNPVLQAFAAVDKRISKKWARLLVIDGLDECQGANTQRYIVRILSTALIHKKIPLFILVSSQPEPPIRDSFNSYDLREAITTLVLDEHYLSDAEIRRYFFTRFDQIRQTHPNRAQLPAQWPSNESVNHLMSRAAGQFIYATTVIKYIQSPQHRPTERLDQLLRLSNPLQSIPFAELDCIYRHVFHSVHNIKGVLRILGALLFAQRIFSKKSRVGSEVPIPVTDPRFLEELLSLNRGDVSFILGDLDSILNVPDSRKVGSAGGGANGNANANGVGMASAGAGGGAHVNASASAGASVAGSGSGSANGGPPTTTTQEGIRILHSSLIDFLTDRFRAGKHFINSVKVHAELARACVRNMLSGHKYVHQYCGQALVTHCRYSVLTQELTNDLYHFDLAAWLATCKTWNDGGGPFEQAWIDMPNLFTWFKSQVYPDPSRDLYDRHMTAWDHYLQDELKPYLSSTYLSSILVFLTFPTQLWDWIHFAPLLGLKYEESEEIVAADREYLHLMGLKSVHEPYRIMMAQFLGDRERAEEFFVTSEMYAGVALKVARYLFEPKQPGKLYQYPLPPEWVWYRRDHEDKIFREKKTKETFQAGLQYLSFFLSMAGEDNELKEYLSRATLDPVRAKELPREGWAIDKKAVEDEVERYLKRFPLEMQL